MLILWDSSVKSKLVLLKVKVFSFKKEKEQKNWTEIIEINSRLCKQDILKQLPRTIIISERFISFITFLIIKNQTKDYRKRLQDLIFVAFLSSAIQICSKIFFHAESRHIWEIKYYFFSTIEIPTIAGVLMPNTLKWKHYGIWIDS